MADRKSMNRRQFIKRTAGAMIGGIVFPYIIPSSVLGRSNGIAPSDKIIVGSVGMGGMGRENMMAFLNEPDSHVLAVCDVDVNHLQRAKRQVDDFYGNSDCAAYHDFRELIAKNDIDVISLATPDHWHAIVAISAAKAGKDIYGEKPISHSLLEGRAMCDAVKRYGRIWQTGSWQRSQANFRFACELVINGRIGKVHSIEVGLPGGHDYSGGRREKTVTTPPKELDYDFWLGPAPYSPYVPARVHYNWRWNLEYGGGQLMDWVGHHVDIAHWGVGLDYTGPVEIDGSGIYPKDGLWNAPTEYTIKCKYAGGVEMIISSKFERGTRWYGSKGWVSVSRRKIDAQPRKLLKEVIGPNETKLYYSDDHCRNFLDCVKTRRQTITPAEVAHRSASVGHLGSISMRLGRKIYFDPETEQITGDSTASGMLGKSMRSPWHL